MNDQILPLSNVSMENGHLGQGKSIVDLDATIAALLLPNLYVVENENFKEMNESVLIDPLKSHMIERMVYLSRIQLQAMLIHLSVNNGEKTKILQTTQLSSSV